MFINCVISGKSLYLSFLSCKVKLYLPYSVIMKTDKIIHVSTVQSVLCYTNVRCKTLTSCFLNKGEDWNEDVHP